MSKDLAITKEHIAMHTYLNFNVLHSSAFVIKLLNVIES